MTQANDKKIRLTDSSGKPDKNKGKAKMLQTQNITTDEAVVQSAKQIIYIHQEFQPEYNKAATAELNEQKLRAQGKDVSGKYMQQLEKPVSRKAAWKKLEASSKKANRAMAMLDELEA